MDHITEDQKKAHSYGSRHVVHLDGKRFLSSKTWFLAIKKGLNPPHTHNKAAVVKAASLGQFDVRIFARTVAVSIMERSRTPSITTQVNFNYIIR